MEVYGLILKELTENNKKDDIENQIKGLVDRNVPPTILKKLRLELKGVKSQLLETRRQIRLHKGQLKGGALKAGLIREFFIQSHNKKLENVENYVIDKAISNKYVKVYHNSVKNWTVLVHRGSSDLADVFVDSQLLVNHKDNDRFKMSKNIQKLAEEKYDPFRITVLGSSLGGVLAEDSASDGVFEIITAGKPTLPIDLVKGHKTKDNQYDVRTNTDIISSLKPFQKFNKNDINLKSKTPFNPLLSHFGSEVFSERYFDKDELIGRKEKEGGEIDINKMKVDELKDTIKRIRKNKKLPCSKWKVTKLKKYELKALLEKIITE